MDISTLVMWLMGEVLIAIGVPVFAMALYLLAPEERKRKILRGVLVIGIVWMAAGVLVYIRVLLGAIMRP